MCKQIIFYVDSDISHHWITPSQKERFNLLDKYSNEALSEFDPIDPCFGRANYSYSVGGILDKALAFANWHSFEYRQRKHVLVICQPLIWVDLIDEDGDSILSDGPTYFRIFELNNLLKHVRILKGLYFLK